MCLCVCACVHAQRRLELRLDGLREAVASAKHERDLACEREIAIKTEVRNVHVEQDLSQKRVEEPEQQPETLTQNRKARWCVTVLFIYLGNCNDASYLF